MDWLMENRKDLAEHVTIAVPDANAERDLQLLAFPSRERLLRVLRYLLDENEFLSPYGIRSLSKIHAEQPYTFCIGGKDHHVRYTPGESTASVFGGNSNWRGPIWLPVNFLLIEALEQYHHFYGDSLKVEVPTGSGNWQNLVQAAAEIETRLARLLLPDENGRRSLHSHAPRWSEDPHWNEYPLSYEYFHGDTGQGLGASHQTGWTALIAICLEDRARERNETL